MGVVYRAQDTRLGRTVAIKALPAELAGDQARLERFEREARTLGQLNHPNLAGIYGLEELDRAKYLVLEFVEGETLADRLDRGPVPVDEAVELAVQIAAGVEAAHEAGVIHRDLKPANVMITPDGQAKVLDFGLARTDDGQSTSSMSDAPTLTSPAQHSPTMPGVILGTAAYMSPEQARGRRVDRRTDIWSFGVVLYEMLTGSSPFVGETVSDSIGAVLHKECDFERLPPATPTNVKRVLTRCLQRDKSMRYRDIGDVRLELLGGSLEENAAQQAARSSLWIGAVLVLSLGMLGMAASLVILLLDRGSTPAERFITDIAPPEGMLLARQRGGFDLSPDGKSLAFLAYRDGNECVLCVRDLATGETRVIEEADSPKAPFWSPDGRSIAYFSRWGLETIDLDGGDPRRVRSGWTSVISGGYWVDEERILYSPFVSPMVEINPDTGAFREVLDPVPDSDVDWPVAMRLLPNGTHVVYYLYDAGTAPKGLYIADLTSGETRELLASTTAAIFVEPDWLVFRNGGFLQRQRLDVEGMELVGHPERIAPDAVLMNLYELAMCSATADVLAYMPALEGSGEDENEFVILDRETGERTPLGVRGELWSPQVSPDGSKILYDRTTRQTAGDIAMYDLERGIESIIVRTAVNEQSPFWGFGGETVYYRATPDNYATRIDGLGSPEVVEEGTVRSLARKMTSDGSLVFFDRDGGIKVLETATGEIRDWLTTPAYEGIARVGFNDEWVVYLSDAFGETRVMMRRVSGEGDVVQLSSGAGSSPEVAGDEVFYNTRTGVMAVRVEFDETGEPVVGEPQVVVSRTDLRDWDVMPDGKRLLLDRRLVPDRGGVIRVIKNWQTGLSEPE